MFLKTVYVLLLAFSAAMLMSGQAAKPGPDTIVFTNGDKLVGTFVSSDATHVIFKSDAVGELTIDWKKVQELHTGTAVAVIRQGEKLHKHQDTSSIPQGTLTMREQNLQITPAAGAPPQSIPVAQSAVVVPEPDFQTAMTRSPGILSDWTGSITAGATLVQATQDSRSFNGALSLIRAEPTEAWLNPSYRTTLTFLGTYGEITQPLTPTVKTSIYHAAAEQDQYFTPSVFAFVQADFDHNFSQGLVLQQTYNGGIGWTVVKNAIEELDLKGSMSYIHQDFQVGKSLDLVGSLFSERYSRKLPHSVVMDQRVAVTPAWNNTSAYSAAASVLFTMPVYKRLSGSTGVIDTFLNNPPPGFRKNSFQYTLGLTYSLQ